MKLLLKVFLPLMATVFVLTLALLPLAERMTTEWFVADVKMRSKLIFASIEDNVRDALKVGEPKKIEHLFSRVAQDERVMGLAYCTHGNNKPLYASTAFPENYVCENKTLTDQSGFTTKQMSDGSVLYAEFALFADNPVANPYSLIIVHDLSFIDAREKTTKFYALTFLLIICSIAAATTAFVAKLVLSNWSRSLRDFIKEGKPSQKIPRDLAPLVRDIQKEIRSLEKEYNRQWQNQSVWTEKSLQNFIADGFAGSQVLVASFREPISHVPDENGVIQAKRNVNGLVTALEPIVRACAGTWIAIGVGSGLDKTLDRVKIDELGKHYFIKRIRTSESDYNSFYHGICSGGLYPLCCSMGYIKPNFCEEDWKTYIRINELYAQAILDEAKGDSPIVLVQDYQLALVPKLIKEKLPNAIVILYWHIPWPNSEIFGIMPWGGAFLDGILSSDIVGFQTPYMCNNFFDAVRANLEARIDEEHDCVERHGHICKVRAYPVSVEWPLERLSLIEDVASCRQAIRAKFGIPLHNKVFLGIERLDYVKGIPERLSAFKKFLEENPKLHGKVNFIQVAALSPRKELDVYTRMADEIFGLVDEINGKFSTSAWTPVTLITDNQTKEDVYRYYRAADICVVSSLHDGMNLVAKEFIATREDERGVIIISRFAGAIKEFPNALCVNPHDQRSFIDAYLAAVSMDEDMQEQQMKSMREHLKNNNIYRWAGKLLQDAAVLQKQNKFNKVVSAIGGSAALEEPLSTDIVRRSKIVK